MVFLHIFPANRGGGSLEPSGAWKRFLKTPTTQQESERKNYNNGWLISAAEMRLKIMQYCVAHHVDLATEREARSFNKYKQFSHIGGFPQTLEAHQKIMESLCECIYKTVLFNGLVSVYIPEEWIIFNLESNAFFLVMFGKEMDDEARKLWATSLTRAMLDREISVEALNKAPISVYEDLWRACAVHHSNNVPKQ